MKDFLQERVVYYFHMSFQKVFYIHKIFIGTTLKTRNDKIKIRGIYVEDTRIPGNTIRKDKEKTNLTGSAESLYGRKPLTYLGIK